jgi:uncharacterized lipoprotein YehR (DUF1307 family)
MKKLLYIVLFALVSSVSITACTEEEIKPASDGGAANDPIKR